MTAKEREEYITKLKNSKSWFKFYKQQKLIGDILLEKLTSKELIKKGENSDDYSDFTTIFVNAHYHWGIAIENGLKALYVKNFPEKIEYKISGNDVRLISIGGKAGKRHNLYKLAKEVGVFETGIFKYDSDWLSLKQVLLHLSDMIKWGARYPLPKNTATVFKLSKDVPPILVYGFHILDVMQPLFDFIEAEIRTDRNTKEEIDVSILDGEEKVDLKSNKN